jgi:hypothetical protein
MKTFLRKVALWLAQRLFPKGTRITSQFFTQEEDQSESFVGVIQDWLINDNGRLAYSAQYVVEEKLDIPEYYVKSRTNHPRILGTLLRFVNGVKE